MSSIAVKKKNFRLTDFIGEILGYWDDWQYHILVDDEPIVDVDEECDLEFKQIAAMIRRKINDKNEVFFGFSQPYANEAIQYIGGEVDYQERAEELGLDDVTPPIDYTDIFGIVVSCDKDFLVFDTAINFGGMHSGVSYTDDGVFDPIISGFVESFVKIKKAFASDMKKWRNETETQAIKKDPDAAMFKACRTGDLERAKLCLELGAKINDKINEYWGLTPLFYSAQYNYLDLVKLLLDSGADVNAETYAGTLLDALNRCREGTSEYPIKGKCSDEIISLLVSKGAVSRRKKAKKDGKKSEK